MSAATRKNLIEHLRMGDVDAAAVSAAIREAYKVSWSRSGDVSEAGTAVDEVLELADRLMNGHGVEPIHGDYHVDGYYRDIVALYVNVGDSYEPTLLYETDKDRFLVTSWGDWVERNERRYKIQ